MNAPLALFSDMESCMRWLTLTAPHMCETVKGPAFSRWQKSNEREQTDEKPKAPRYGAELAAKPKGLDAAGQIGMLGSFFKRLPPDQMYHCLAKYLDPGPKPKENSRTFDHDKAQRLWIIEQRRNAREFLAMLMQAEFDKDVDLRVFVALVQKFYGERTSLAKLAKQSGLTRYRVGQLDADVFVSLDALQVRAEQAVYGALERGGVIA
ncbi:MAG: hypothetical protein ACM31O_17415 [Bacteroidota bacterium]